MTKRTRAESEPVSQPALFQLDRGKLDESPDILQENTRPLRFLALKFCSVHPSNLADPNTLVYVNLNGVDIWPGVQRAASGRGGAMDWELLQIRQNPQPQFWNTIKFWKNGKVVVNPFK